MPQHDQREPEEGKRSDAASRKLVRRTRHFTPPGLAFPRRQLFSRSHLRNLGRVELGDVVAELTPRQAVVWLLNLDTMISLYESATDRELDAAARERLSAALREIVRNAGRPG